MVDTTRIALQQIVEFLSVECQGQDNVISGRYRLRFNYAADPRFADQHHNSEPAFMGNVDAALCYLAELLDNAKTALSKDTP